MKRSIELKKYTILLLSIIQIGLSIISIYKIYQPKVGPIGDGNISPLFWVSTISFLVSGLSFLSLSVYMFWNEKNREI